MLNATRPLAAALAALSLVLLGSFTASADDAVVAKINGKAITDADLKLAEAEIGPELGNLPPPTKRRVLVEYLIENQLLATAAEDNKLASGPQFEQRAQYWRRRALRDTYFDTSIKDAVKEADAKKIYDQQVSAIKPTEEIRAAHILVKEEAKAKELSEKISKGGDFAALAKEFSIDPGSKDNGGDLGYFAKGQMVPQFEEAAFKLGKGEVSAPVQTQFGWHIIKVSDKRDRQPPAFDAVKDRLMASMVNQKAQEVVTNLRSKAQIEYVDPEIKAAVDAEKKAGEAKPGAPAKQ